LLIGVSALELGYAVGTSNLRHFQMIPKLVVTRLGRDVAIKVLPAAFADDPERLARFEREAHLLAALNHPNIAAIYGREESEGQRFLVLEYVPGETLGSAGAGGRGCGRAADHRRAGRGPRARHRPP